MQTLTTIASVRETVRAWRAQGLCIGLVPTMGNLHAGHMELVRAARASSARVVASIFVNPMQFGPDEDLQAYPRTPAADAEKLQIGGVDLLFSPKVEEVYPDGVGASSQVVVPELSGILCGASRPGHFAGVATVVTKLFNIVQPDSAVFGEKDYQQLVVIRRIVRDLCMPIEILGVPTMREADGLAMSSRNSYLTANERGRAPALYQALRTARDRLQGGETDLARIAAEGEEALNRAGMQTEYFTVRCADDLQPVGTSAKRLVVLAAARLGRARLIDNIAFQR